MFVFQPVCGKTFVISAAIYVYVSKTFLPVDFCEILVENFNSMNRFKQQMYVLFPYMPFAACVECVAQTRISYVNTLMQVLLTEVRDVALKLTFDWLNRSSG